MTISREQADAILSQMKHMQPSPKLQLHQDFDKAVGEDFWFLYPNQLQALSIHPTDLIDHEFYCGTESHKETHTVHVFQKSQLEKFIGTPEVSARAQELVGKLKGWQR